VPIYKCGGKLAICMLANKLLVCLSTSTPLLMFRRLGKKHRYELASADSNL